MVSPRFVVSPKFVSLVQHWFGWLGDYPFEVAKPEEVIDFCLDQSSGPIQGNRAFN